MQGLLRSVPQVWLTLADSHGAGSCALPTCQQVVKCLSSLQQVLSCIFPCRAVQHHICVLFNPDSLQTILLVQVSQAKQKLTRHRSRHLNQPLGKVCALAPSTQGSLCPPAASPQPAHSLPCRYVRALVCSTVCMKGFLCCLIT